MHAPATWTRFLPRAGGMGFLDEFDPYDKMIA